MITIDLLKASKMQLHLTAPCYCIFLYSSLVAYHHRNTEIVYPRRDFGRKREREKGQREREKSKHATEERGREQKQKKENGKRNDGKYERELRVTAENGGLCVFNPPWPACPPSSISLSPSLRHRSRFAVAQTRFRKPPSYVWARKVNFDFVATWGALWGLGGRQPGESISLFRLPRRARDRSSANGICYIGGCGGVKVRWIFTRSFVRAKI